jgi:hypothetical protein
VGKHAHWADTVGGRGGVAGERSGTVTPEQAANHDCTTQSELTAIGRQHVEQIGAAMRALNLPIATVRTARLCRTETTGRVVNLTPVTDDDRLDASSTNGTNARNTGFVAFGSVSQPREETASSGPPRGLRPITPVGDVPLSPGDR